MGNQQTGDERRRHPVVAVLKSSNEPKTVLTIKSYTQHVSYPAHDVQAVTAYFPDESDDDRYVWPLHWENGHNYDAGIKLQFVFDAEKPIIGLWNIERNGDVAWREYPSLKFSKNHFLDKLFACQKLTVYYRLESGVIKSAPFDLSGTNDIIGPLLATGHRSTLNK
jgi:hypothetical protein